MCTGDGWHHSFDPFASPHIDAIQAPCVRVEPVRWLAATEPARAQGKGISMARFTRSSNTAARSVIRVGDGRGFVVKGRRPYERLIITASHCLHCLPTGFGIGHVEERTYGKLLAGLGQKPAVAAECLFVDPVSDLAVLAARRIIRSWMKRAMLTTRWSRTSSRLSSAPSSRTAKLASTHGCCRWLAIGFPAPYSTTAGHGGRQPVPSLSRVACPDRRSSTMQVQPSVS